MTRDTSGGVDRSFLMGTYRPPRVTFVRGQGTELWDSEGRRYLDFLSGLAVVSLGHSHPEVATALAEQARTLLHVSNLYGTVPAPRAAATLDRLVSGFTGAHGQVFFANSGAEANECAIKLARKWAGPGRYVVLSTLGSFHGRTLATLHATGQLEKHPPFEPLPEGFEHVAYDDIAAMKEALDPARVAAVLIEPIQGEAGVIQPAPGYLAQVRRLCTERGVLLMMDEVQTGLGRTGRWFGFQHSDVQPDVVTMAKALGNGVPVGACWARGEVAAAFGPGDHATTFGGQPLAMAAVNATLAVMEAEDVPGRAARSGEQLRQGLLAIPGVVEVRGQGLLLGAGLARDVAGEIEAGALARGLVVNAARPDTVRLAPPLLVSSEQVDEALSILRDVMGEVLAGTGSTGA
ncbi:MAG: acetylornithine transaminase [Acidimicrobiales bacterium]